MKLRVLAVLTLLGCGDDGDDTCERYKALSKVMVRSDPQLWSEAQRCPSDAEIAAKNWSATTLAECVARLEEQCEGVDVERCNRDQDAGFERCICRVGLGNEARTTCIPF